MSKIGLHIIHLLQECDTNDPNNIAYKRYVHIDNMYDILLDIHINCGHGGRDRMWEPTKAKYANITIEIIKLFLTFCENCVLKQYTTRSGFVTNPIVTSDFNSHVQADLIDMQGQECQEFRFIFVYQDHFSKLVQIRPLKRKTAKAVTASMVDLFVTFGPPDKLQTDNGREFKNQTLEAICKHFRITMVHGLPRHSQTNGGVERANQDIEKMLVTWKADHPNLPWVTGLQFVQMYKNNALCAPIKMSPFELTFGYPMSHGLQDSIIPEELFPTTNCEEDLHQLGVIPSDDDDVDLVSN